eukprot:TRINITY_DN867_c7_g1_i1.p1 TRINITY_DN867_c7_g1~~TRINITY_DN867_c7_g1_i1.p1  ORF type:complete len:227 (-),score=74.72 TRINITY_DN867_c7_g1_i1:85-702(-)
MAALSARNTGRGGLSCLEAVQKKLEEDRSRQRAAAALLTAGRRSPPLPSGAGVRSPQPGSDRRLPQHLAAAAAAADPRRQQCGPGDEAIAANDLVAEPEVQHPMAREALLGDKTAAAAAGAAVSGGYQATAELAPAGKVDIMAFRADKSNFSHILHFLRDGQQWKVPEDATVRQSLREEAHYFGCPGIVAAMDLAEAKGLVPPPA